jgi:hypothetical protein
MKDPVVQAERMERLHKIKELTQKVHANKDRIRRNIETIDRAGEDNKAAAIELAADTSNLNDLAGRVGLMPTQSTDKLIDALVGLLVELPAYGTPAAVPAPNPFTGVANASGKQLDAIGAGFACSRSMGESDSAYRARVHSAITKRLPLMPEHDADGNRLY